MIRITTARCGNHALWECTQAMLQKIKEDKNGNAALMQLEDKTKVDRKEG